MTAINGYPAWVRASDHTTYGGDLNKKNWQSQGVVDARTDVDAAALCRLAEDLSACSRTCPFGVISWTCVDTPTPGVPLITAVNLMTGIAIVDYSGDAPPTGFPSAARNGTGDVTFTFAASYSDAYGVAGAFSPVHALAGSRTSGAYATAAISGQTVRVRLLDTADSGVSNSSGTLMVL
jgi:hypothetical protein